MTKTFGQELLESLNEALDYTMGKPTNVQVHVVQVPDVRAIRETTGLSQQEFARAYRIPLATLKGWEQGRRHPDRTVAAYLSVIAQMPEEARRALAA
ncbi:MAG TPA: helix-turn-helix domain-containing protein [Allosphingosinicella sp.]|nr:helix-turn-helix domain-containing protein [Allosphingosinicella sp.]